MSQGDDVVLDVDRCGRSSISIGGDDVAEVADVPLGVAGAAVGAVEGVEVRPGCHTVVLTGDTSKFENSIPVIRVS